MAVSSVCAAHLSQPSQVIGSTAIGVCVFWIKRLPTSSQCLVEASKIQLEEVYLFIQQAFMGHVLWVRENLGVKHKPHLQGAS